MGTSFVLCSVRSRCRCTRSTIVGLTCRLTPPSTGTAFGRPPASHDRTLAMKKILRPIGWLIAFLNVAVVAYGVLFYIPAFAYSRRMLERYVSEGNLDRVARFASSVLEANSSISFYFLPCFVLMLLNTIFIFLALRGTSEK